MSKNKNYKPKIELHPCLMVYCEKCEEEFCVHFIDGEVPTIDCDCGKEYEPDELLELGYPAWFFDCDSCGLEIICCFPVIAGKYEIPEIIDCPNCEQEYSLRKTARKDNQSD